ncbi:MAG TPA: anthranilate synthase component I [Tepidisphaeraceae bacterium]|nr:anthranilate synthase component I [Tepidisphaeraceae bacterium]
MPRYFPDADAFAKIAADGAQVIPVYRQLLADRLTPVTAFELLGDSAYAFLLESVVGIEKIGRYSFIATSPRYVYEAKDGRATVRHLSGSQQATAHSTTDPLTDLAKLLPKRRYHHDDKLPPFTGGLVGYAGYDTIRYYESEKLTAPPADDRGLPDLQFAFYGELVIFDHLDKTIKVVANAELPTQDSALSTPDSYQNACRRIDALIARLQKPVPGESGEIDTSGPVTLPFQSNMTRDQYEAAVSAGQEYIKAGDIFQFVPSQRLRVTSAAPPFDVYRALRVINPSPFMFYLKSPACTLIGASPEVLCRVQDGVVTSRPLAGTRRRGHTPAEDKELERELLADPKDRAEHIMLVDLHRNDVGRVSVIGTVKVDECMVIERYSHVMHISSNVTGMLAPDKTALDALAVSLPVGTVSGAPKIRAMQIIDELEPTRRGPYGGAVGYLDFAGNMDTCIALRTIVWIGEPALAGGSRSEPRSATYDVQAGAGVVADSVPALEWEETMNKAKALLKAVEAAGKGF